MKPCAYSVDINIGSGLFLCSEDWFSRVSPDWGRVACPLQGRLLFLFVMECLSYFASKPGMRGSSLTHSNMGGSANLHSTVLSS